MEFSKKMMGFPLDLVSFSTNSRQKDMRKSVSHFLQGFNNSLTLSLFSFLLGESSVGGKKKRTQTDSSSSIGQSSSVVSLEVKFNDAFS